MTNKLTNNVAIDTDGCKVFDVIADGKRMGVWDRPNHEHQLGIDNGQCATWWLKYDIHMELNENRKEHEPAEYKIISNWVPWIDLCNNRPCWELSFKQDNKTKFKWNRVQIDGVGQAIIICNKIVVAEFSFNDLNWAMAKAQVRMAEMYDEPFDFMNIESEIGRKIWYYEQPGIITSFYNGEIDIQYDGTDNNVKGFDLRLPSNTDDSTLMESENNQSIRTTTTDHHISWFR